MTDQILKIIEDAQDEFMGLNEGNLHAAERIAALYDQKEIDEFKPLFFNKDWPEVNTSLLVNFLRLPIEHQRSLVEAMKERVPEVFENKWKAYPENKPTEIGMYLIIQNGFDAALFDWWASDMFVAYDDVVAFLPIPKYKP